MLSLFLMLIFLTPSVFFWFPKISYSIKRFFVTSSEELGFDVISYVVFAWVFFIWKNLNDLMCILLISKYFLCKAELSSPEKRLKDAAQFKRLYTDHVQLYFLSPPSAHRPRSPWADPQLAPNAGEVGGAGRS